MPQNSWFEIAKRRKEIAELHLQGLSNYEISVRLGISLSQVGRDLKAVEKEWQKQRIADIETVKNRDLAKLDYSEKQLWAAWVRSCDKISQQKVKKVSLMGGDPVEREREIKALQGIGDPRYISEILKCIQLRAKILGYEAAQKIDLSFERLSDVQLDQLMNKLIE